MQKGLGIAGLVIAIVSVFIPILGPWLTIIAAGFAAFAFGSGLPLGVAAIIINLVNVIFLSPSVWIHGAMISGGAQAQGDEVVFLPWVILGAQAIAIGVLVAFHKGADRKLEKTHG